MTPAAEIEKFRQAFDRARTDEEYMLLAQQAINALVAQQGRVEAEKRQLVGWLSGDIPELHRVEMGRLADSLDRFNAAKLAPATEPVAAQAGGYANGKPFVGITPPATAPDMPGI